MMVDGAGITIIVVSVAVISYFVGYYKGYAYAKKLWQQVSNDWEAAYRESNADLKFMLDRWKKVKPSVKT